MGGAAVGAGMSHAAFSPQAQAMPGFGPLLGGQTAYRMPGTARTAYPPSGRYPAPGSYADAGPFASPPHGAPAYAYGYGAAAPAPRRGTTPKRLLVIAGVTLLALTSIGGLMSLVRATMTPKAASGPPLTLSTFAPAFLVGRVQSGPAETARVRATMQPFVTTMRQLPGSGQTLVQPYGPGTLGDGAPYRGPDGEIVLMWNGFAAPFSQRDMAAGLIHGGRSYYTNPTVLQTNEADGGVLACIAETTRTQERAAALCYWLRSGTGMVVIAETGVPAATVQQDARQAVANMVHLAP
jgi:hypothetical protein